MLSTLSVREGACRQGTSWDLYRSPSGGRISKTENEDHRRCASATPAVFDPLTKQYIQLGTHFPDEQAEITANR